MGRNYNDTPNTGPVKFFRSIANKYSSRNNSTDISVVFTFIAFYSLYNEKTGKNKVCINGEYYTRLTLVTIRDKLNIGRSKSTISRILDILIEDGLIDCIEPDDDETFALGNYYKISKLGLSLIEDEYYWLENDVDYAISKKGINSSSNNKSSNVIHGGLFDGIPIK